MTKLKSRTTRPPRPAPQAYKSLGAKTAAKSVADFRESIERLHGNMTDDQANAVFEKNGIPPAAEAAPAPAEAIQPVPAEYDLSKDWANFCADLRALKRWISNCWPVRTLKWLVELFGEALINAFSLVIIALSHTAWVPWCSASQFGSSGE
jgi:hypothetical protein